MATKQVAQVTVNNSADAVAEFWIGHSADAPMLQFTLIPASGPDGVDRYQYPRSTGYHITSLGRNQAVTFQVEFAAGPNAGMDYWYVAVRMTAGSHPGSFSQGGTVLQPTTQVKIPDSGILDIQLTAAPNFDAPYLNIRGVTTSSTWMGVDKVWDAAPTIRKSVATLTATERAGYVAAVKRLKAAPSRLTPATHSRYDDYVLVHMLAMNMITVNDRTKPIDNSNITIGGARTPMWAHQSPAFVPWHREFLRQFERDLRGDPVDPKIAIPYWDWTVNADPTLAPWLPDLMGGDGHDGPVTTGPFAGNAQWPLTLSGDNQDHLIRGFGLAEGYGRLPFPVEVGNTLSAEDYDKSTWDDSSTLDSFRNRLEGWYTSGSPQPHTTVGMHNLVHVWVGGNNGTMLPGSSPNDPVFFLHHCNIDRLWWFWQLTRTDDQLPPSPMGPLYAPAKPVGNMVGQALDQQMIFMDPAVATAPWSDPPATPADVISHHALNYLFDNEIPESPAP